MYEFVDGHRLLKVLGLFLMSYCIGRNKLYARLEAIKPSLKKMLGVTLAIGLPTSVLYAISATTGHQWGLTIHSLLYAVSALPMAFAYICAVCLLLLRHPNGILFRLLAKPGRMALTNYIGQSVIGILIYYGIGLGLGCSMGLWQVEVVAIVVFIAQIACSHLWMQFFRYGPLEWAWRMLTYGRWLKLRK